MARITKAHVRRPCTFHGYDGKKYAGTVKETTRAYVVIEYFVPGPGYVTAYVEHKNRDRLEIH